MYAYVVSSMCLNTLIWTYRYGKHFFYIHISLFIYVRGKAKQKNFKEKIAQCRNSSSDLWKTLKFLDICKKNSQLPSSSIGLDIDSKITFDKKTVANTFNHFFTTIAANLVAKLPDISGGFVGLFIDTYYSLKGVKKDSLKFTPISEEETLKHLLNLSSGLDGMPARFIKDGATQITAPITHIINLSLYSGNVPDKMKTACSSVCTALYELYHFRKIILKPTRATIYRLVSILSVFSKKLERVVYNQIESYMTSQNLFLRFTVRLS